MTPAKPRGFPAQLDKKIDVAEGLAIFRVVFNQDFVFKCGQYATLWLTHRGETVPRPYSIASSPSEKRALEFYINLVAEGKLTPWLWNPEVLQGLQNGDPETTLSITGPKGNFVLDPADQRDLVFVASGTGLAPFMSMVRKLNEDYLNAAETSGTRRIYLVHGVSYSDNFGYRQELEQLAAECLNNPARKLGLVYLPTISRPQMDPTWHGLKGRAESLFEDLAPRNSKPLDLDDTVKAMMRALLRPETHAVYICGHPGTIDNTARILSSRGFAQPKDLKFEKYYT